MMEPSRHYDNLLYSITECCINEERADAPASRSALALARGQFVTPKTEKSPELLDLGESLARARRERGFSQTELAGRSGLSQAQISYFEVGLRQPSLDQLLRIAGALGASVQKLLTGSDKPGTELKDLAIELRCLGLVDLWVKSPTVPGAFRSPEEVVALAVAGDEVDPRIIEAIPALLAWNKLSPLLLKAYGMRARPRTTRRLAWLADVALAVDRRGGFPGGCRRDQLVRFTRMISTPDRKSFRWDSMGRPMAKTATSPIWKRWGISYESSLENFRERASHLHELLSKPFTPSRLKGVRGEHEVPRGRSSSKLRNSR
jgi:DNA-binding XRE family transcriptional regulator